jgi:L-2-hydroxyglutarate oxidase LhgO
MLYAFCEENRVPFRRCGKMVAATDPAEIGELERVFADAHAAGVEVQEIDPAACRDRMRNPRVVAALWSPSSGIVDSHQLMLRLETLAKDRGVLFAYRSAFLRIEDARPGSCRFIFSEEGGEEHTARTRVLINAAGLAAARIARDFLPGEHIAIRPCCGRYFSLASRWTNVWQHLVYPLPDPAGGLGVHLTIDLAGRCRLGPDLDWSRAFDAEPDDQALYRFEESQGLQERFHEAGRRLLPDLQLADLSPDYVGVRPKLFIDAKEHPDFLVKSSQGGAAGHLLGIESPGLTGALALAEDLAASVA